MRRIIGDEMHRVVLENMRKFCVFDVVFNLREINI